MINGYARSFIIGLPSLLRLQPPLRAGSTAIRRDFGFNRAENRLSVFIQHFDTHDIAVFEEWGEPQTIQFLVGRGFGNRPIARFMGSWEALDTVPAPISMPAVSSRVAAAWAINVG